MDVRGRLHTRVCDDGLTCVSQIPPTLLMLGFYLSFLFTFLPQKPAGPQRQGGPGWPRAPRTAQNNSQQTSPAQSSPVSWSRPTMLSRGRSGPLWAVWVALGPLWAALGRSRSPCRLGLAAWAFSRHTPCRTKLGSLKKDVDDFYSFVSKNCQFSRVYGMWMRTHCSYVISTYTSHE